MGEDNQRMRYREQGQSKRVAHLLVRWVAQQQELLLGRYTTRSPYFGFENESGILSMSKCS